MAFRAVPTVGAVSAQLELPGEPLTVRGKGTNCYQFHGLRIDGDPHCARLIAAVKSRSDASQFYEPYRVRILLETGRTYTMLPGQQKVLTVDVVRHPS